MSHVNENNWHHGVVHADAAGATHVIIHIRERPYLQLVSDDTPEFTIGDAETLIEVLQFAVAKAKVIEELIENAPPVSTN